jgi:hypothetical protein
LRPSFLVGNPAASGRGIFSALARKQSPRGAGLFHSLALITNFVFARSETISAWRGIISLTRFDNKDNNYFYEKRQN